MGHEFQNNLSLFIITEAARDGGNGLGHPTSRCARNQPSKINGIILRVEDIQARIIISRHLQRYQR